jgi:hypothetical protein
MSYFNHAFVKTFVGVNAANPQNQGYTSKNRGVLGTEGNILETGQFAFVNPKTWKIQDTNFQGDCCPLILASGSLLSRDKIGPFHGGYLESNKSKEINPKYVSKFYFAPACPASNNVIHVGKTPYTDDQVLEVSINNSDSNLVDGVYNQITFNGGNGQGFIGKVTVENGNATLVEIVNGGTGYNNGNNLCIADNQIAYQNGGFSTNVCINVNQSGTKQACEKEFLCGETYNLRLDVKGSPALRFLNHNAYLTLTAYTGCCPEGSITPTVVDSTEVFIKWAQQIVDSPLIAPFIYPVVSDENYNLWYKPGTDTSSLNAPSGYNIGGTWDKYVSPGHNTGEMAGLVLFGAYVDTKFGDCTFQVSDFYEKEPVRLYASEVDLNGDPCAFEGLCVVTECQGRQANGLGETVLRDVILSERYNQNFFHSDFRIREITQGNQILNAINRSAFYNRFFIQHNVPRFNNPTSTFDNDQYLLEIIVDENINPNDNWYGEEFTNFVENWLGQCGNQCSEIEIFDCGNYCEPVVDVPSGI